MIKGVVKNRAHQSLREIEFALQNDCFITKLLKPELPCTPTRQSSPVRTRFEPKAHRVSTGTPSELEASSKYGTGDRACRKK